MQVPLLVDDFLDRSAALYPSKVAIVDGERRFTYAQYAERVNRLSNALLGLGLDGSSLGLQLDSGLRMSMRLKKGGVGFYLRSKF